MARGGIDTAFQDDAGNAINGATVEVFLVNTGTPATIYEEDGTTLLSASGTFLTGWLYGKGEILFTADNGQYDIKITNGLETRWIENVTILDGSSLISTTDLATTTTAGIVEKATTAEMTAGTTDKFPDAAEVKTYVDSEINNLTFLNDDRIVINLTADSNYTLSATENNYSQIEITDTGVVLTGAIEIIIDSTSKLFSFIDSTAQTLTVKTAGGTGYAVTADGNVYDLYSDGTDVTDAPKYIDPTQSRIFNQTPVATTAGTSVSISTSIPSGVKRVVITLSGVSLDAIDGIMLRLGTSGGLVTTGYLGSSTVSLSGTGAVTFSSGFAITRSNEPIANTFHGNVVFDLHDASTNKWVGVGQLGTSNAAGSLLAGGEITLTNELTQISILSIAATGNFDAGSAAIRWEY